MDLFNKWPLWPCARSSLSVVCLNVFSLLTSNDLYFFKVTHSVSTIYLPTIHSSNTKYICSIMYVVLAERFEERSRNLHEESYAVMAMAG